MAVLNGDIPTLQLILESTGESLINNRETIGNTAMHLAIVNRKEDCVKTLLFFYPDLTVRNREGDTALSLAANLHAWDSFLMLCQHGASLLDNQANESWLVLAYRDRHISALEWLLEHGSNWNDIDAKVMNLLVFWILILVE